MKTRTNPLETAIRLAVEKHTGQRDKAGAPYVLHPLRVMFAVEGEAARIAAVLHDVVEDTPVKPDDLRAAGIPEDAVRLVGLLTRFLGQSKAAYYKALAADPTARAIKLADLEDNMDIRRLRRVTPRDARRLGRYRRWWGWLKAKGGRE